MPDAQRPDRSTPPRPSRAAGPAPARTLSGSPIVVVGAGAIGCSTALHLAQAGHEVLVLDKEPAAGLHQSGRNSGVLHAGYNLKPGSLKARYCVEGNRLARRFCTQNGVAVRDGGIVVVARTEAETATLRELKRRADANGVRTGLLDASGLAEAEPNAVGIAALRAPEAASFDAVGYVQALQRAAEEAGARFRFGVRVLAIGPDAGPGGAPLLWTTAGPVRARAAVNAAGLHADRLAGDLAPDVRVIPFRGYYAELVPERRHLVRSHVYAAPDLDVPFLGVHLSRRHDGRVVVGPGAMLAFGREAYRLGHIHLRDAAAMLAWPGLWRMLAGRRMRALARSELAKSLQLRAIAKEASLVVPGLRARDLRRAFAGNRAQLVDRQGNLVDDILVRERGREVHVLNAVSPGLTSSLPFGRDLAKRVEALL